MIKPRKRKVKSIENGEIIIAMTISTTLIATVKMKIIIIIMVIMRIKIGNLKQYKTCSSKSNLYFLKRKKRSESHVFLERNNQKQNANVKNRV